MLVNLLKKVANMFYRFYLSFTSVPLIFLFIHVHSIILVRSPKFVHVRSNVSIIRSRSFHSFSRSFAFVHVLIFSFTFIHSFSRLFTFVFLFVHVLIVSFTFVHGRRPAEAEAAAAVVRRWWRRRQRWH